MSEHDTAVERELERFLEREGVAELFAAINPVGSTRRELVRETGVPPDVIDERLRDADVLGLVELSVVGRGEEAMQLYAPTRRGMRVYDEAVEADLALYDPCAGGQPFVEASVQFEKRVRGRVREVLTTPTTTLYG